MLIITSFEFSYSQTLEEIIEGKHRSKENKARDQYRDPLETLKFFGIKNTMTVVEIYPGGGWYQEILAPFLKNKGQNNVNEASMHDFNFLIFGFIGLATVLILFDLFWGNRLQSVRKKMVKGNLE